MDTNRNAKEIIALIEDIIFPYEVPEVYELKCEKFCSQYDMQLIKECIRIARVQYIKKDTNDLATGESAKLFLDKLGGVLYYRHIEKTDPIKSKINHARNKINLKFNYINDDIYYKLMIRYVDFLKANGYTEQEIALEIETICIKFIRISTSWTNWRNNFEEYLEQIDV